MPDIYTLLLLTYIGFCSSIMSYVYIEIMPHEDILGWWFRLGAPLQKSAPWLWKPVFGCTFCNSGWISIFVYLVPVFAFGARFNLYEFLFLISITFIIEKVTYKELTKYFDK